MESRWQPENPFGYPPWWPYAEATGQIFGVEAVAAMRNSADPNRCSAAWKDAHPQYKDLDTWPPKP